MRRVASELACRLEARIRIEQFQPGILGVLTNPLFLVRRALYAAVRDFGQGLEGRILDWGCSRSPYRGLLRNAAGYFGAEINRAELSLNGPPAVVFDGVRLPFVDASFDGVLCTEVLEHVRDVQVTLAEVRRVTRPGASLLFSVPFLWDEHGHPFDFRRFTEDGLRELLTSQGFEIVALRRTLTGARALCQLIAVYLYRAAHSGRFWRDVVSTGVLVAPVTLASVCLGRVLPRGETFYIGVVGLARRRL